jgi:hypothetical protein
MLRLRLLGTLDLRDAQRDADLAVHPRQNLLALLAHLPAPHPDTMQTAPTRHPQLARPRQPGGWAGRPSH